MHRFLILIVLSISVHAASLEDGFRLGKVVDLQGIVAVRPELGKRWTPVENGMILRKGDWLRTDVRGANAVQVKLPGGGQCILGPGGLLEFEEKGEVKFIRGEMEVAPPVEGEVKLVFGHNTVSVKERGLFRLPGIDKTGNLLLLFISVFQLLDHPLLKRPNVVCTTNQTDPVIFIFLAFPFIGIFCNGTNGISTTSHLKFENRNLPLET
jgi:hypothetical protein